MHAVRRKFKQRRHSLMILREYMRKFGASYMDTLGRRLEALVLYMIDSMDNNE